MPSVETASNCAACLESLLTGLVDAAAAVEPELAIPAIAYHTFADPEYWSPPFDGETDVAERIFDAFFGESAKDAESGAELSVFWQRMVAVTKVMIKINDVVGYIKDALDIYEKCFTAQAGSAAGNSAVDDALADLETDLGRLESIVDVYEDFFGNSDWLATSQLTALAQWLGDFVLDTGDTADGSIDAADEAQLLDTTLPDTVTTADATEFLDRWNRTVAYADEGITTASEVPPGESGFHR